MTNLNKTLSWPLTAHPGISSKNIQSKAIKTASLDHITKPSVLSSSPPECLLCRYETSWNEEKETQWPVLWIRKKKNCRGGREGARWELAADCLCNALPSAIGWARRPQMSAHFMQTFHFSPAAIATETKPPQQLCYCWPSANGCLVPGWSGVGGVVNKGEALWDEHCCTDKVVKEGDGFVFICHTATELNPSTFGTANVLVRF